MTALQGIALTVRRLLTYVPDLTCPKAFSLRRHPLSALGLLLSVATSITTYIYCHYSLKWADVKYFFQPHSSTDAKRYKKALA